MYLLLLFLFLTTIYGKNDLNTKTNNNIKSNFNTKTNNNIKNDNNIKSNTVVHRVTDKYIKEWYSTCFRKEKTDRISNEVLDVNGTQYYVSEKNELWGVSNKTTLFTFSLPPLSPCFHVFHVVSFDRDIIHVYGSFPACIIAVEHKESPRLLWITLLSPERPAQGDQGRIPIQRERIKTTVQKKLKKDPTLLKSHVSGGGRVIPEHEMALVGVSQLYGKPCMARVNLQSHAHVYTACIKGNENIIKMDTGELKERIEDEEWKTNINNPWFRSLLDD